MSRNERRSVTAGIIMAVLTTLMALLVARPLRSQTAFETASASIAATRAPVPFQPGEKLVYDVRFGGIKVGTGRMEVLGIENVRGRETWHTRFTVKGGVPLYSVNDRLESWIDTHTFQSLRFVQDLEEGRRDRERDYEIMPERGTYRERRDTAPHPSVSEPLDDAAFIYFVRTLPLEVGKTYQFNRYFIPDRNPVLVRVVRRDTVMVPAGKFSTIVVQPIIKSKGIFSEKGHALLWFTDDSRRLLVQMKSKLSFGSLNLYLSRFTEGEYPPGTQP